MKNIICLLALTLSVQLAFAQSTSDSANYYRNELAELIKAHHDSLLNDPKIKQLRADLKRTSAETDDYKAFVIYTKISSADFKTFNADNAADGFGPFSGAMLSIGYGFSFKKDRRIFDLNIGAFGLNKKVSSGNEDIKTSFSTFLQFEWGYDFIRNKVWNVYPYAGIGFRTSLLEYDSPADVNASPSNVTAVINNNRSVSDRRLEVSYHAGIGVEVVLTNPSVPRGLILFAKGGTNRPFSRNSFDLEGVSYNPHFNFGDGVITAGIKIFAR